MPSSRRNWPKTLGYDENRWFYALLIYMTLVVAAITLMLFEFKIPGRIHISLHGSVVIHNLNVERVASFESEAHSPLIIDSNAPTPFPVALQSFQPVPGRASQISNGLRGIEHLQLSLCYNRNRPEPHVCPIGVCR
jgi:hypothetical protein